MRVSDPTRWLAAALAAVGLSLALPSCTDAGSTGESATAEPSEESLAALVSQNDELSVVSATLQDAGLSQVFDGVAAYTLLAPRDAAFTSLGEAGETLRSPEQRPAMVAVLRDHIVPGYLTPDDIARAVSESTEGKVAMRTMAGHTLTFSKSGDTITATGEDGRTVRIAGEALLARNGVAIPVDGLAVDISEAAAAQ
jgi:uncharacterized surface protein with fasciclin (FAS1) repeats